MDREREGEDQGRGDWSRRAHGHAARQSDQGVAEPRAGRRGGGERASGGRGRRRRNRGVRPSGCEGDRKSTRLNSSHLVISYAVFCLKKKNRRDTGSTQRSSSSS